MPTITDPNVQTMQPMYEITEQDKERINRIARAWQAYEGELEPPLKKLPDQPDPNVMPNEVQPAVDAIGSFLFGEEVEIVVEEGAPETAQIFLDSVWGEHETRLPLLLKLHMNGCMAGRAFLRVIPNPDGSYRLIELDPCIVHVKHVRGDCTTVLLYCIEYCEEGKHNGKPAQIYYREEISRIDPQQDDPDAQSVFSDKDTIWTIQHWTRVGERGLWTPAGEPYDWPFPFPPIFSCQHNPKPNCFWGYPEVRKSLIDIGKAISFVVSNLNLTNKHYGQPILYAPGMGQGTIDIVPGKILQLPLVENDIKAVQYTSDMESGRALANDLRGETEMQTSVPMIASGRSEYMPKGDMSGIAIEMLFMSLLKKMGKQRCLYGALIIEVSRALLVLAGFSEEIKVSIKWQRPLPVNKTEEVNNALTLQQLGIVSKRTLAEELGYDYDEEQERIREEQEQAVIDASRGMGFPPVMPGQQMGQDEEGNEQEQATT